MPKFHGEKAGAKSTPSKVIRYVLNEEKTLAYDTIGLSDEEPYSKQFRQTAALQGSDYGYNERKYYHYKMTFEEKDWDKNGGEITPEKALEMGKEFCEEHFPGHEAVLSVHGDTKNIHVHIVLNAFSYNPDQNKIHINDNEYAELKDSAFKLGQEYGLDEKFWRDEVAEKRERQRQERQNQTEPEPVNISDGEKEIIAQHGKNFSDFSWKEQYRIAIREAAGNTTNLDTFCGYLKEHFNIDTQITNQGNIKYKFPERKTYSSGKALGADYTLDAVEKSLEETKNKPSDLPKELTESEIQALEWREKFNEEYSKFQKWKEEYKNQREEWYRKEKAGEASAEYYRNKAVLENTKEFYRLCEQATENEILYASLTEKELAQLQELEQLKAELSRQYQASQLLAVQGINSATYNPERERVLELREQKRQQYIDTLNTTGTSLIDRINAAQGIRDMNVEEGKKSRENQLYKTYNKDTRRHVIYAKRDWKLQALMDSVYISDQLGAKNSYEFELKVKEEGKKYGKIKREYTAAKKQYEEAVNTACTEISQDSSLSVEEQIKKIDEIKAAEYEKFRPIEEKHQEAKDFYKKCARALDSIKEEEIKVVYRTEGQTVGMSNAIEEEPEVPQRSKEEAEKARLKQWSEIRDWSDEATQTVASQPFTSKEADLKMWAKEMEKQHGCVVRITANTVSVKHPESNQAVRTNRLGGAYEREEIINGISIQREANRERSNAEQQTERDSRTAQGNSRTKNIDKGLSRERSKELEW